MSDVCRPAQATRGRLMAGQVRLLYAQSPILLIGVLLLTVVTAAFLLKEGMSKEIVWSWTAANLLLTCGRVVLILLFRRRRSGDDGARSWAVAFMATAGLSGLLWGSLAIWALRSDEPGNVVYITTVLSAMASASLSSLSAWLPAYFAYLVGSLSLLITGLLTSDDPTLAWLGMLIGFLLLAHVFFAILTNRSIREGLALRDENADLLATAQHQKAIAVQANEAKSRFLASASHDLRQPLHALDLFLGALDSKISEENPRALLAKARQSSRALGDLLNALLDISRIDTGGVEVRLQEFPVATVLDELAMEFSASARDKGLVLEVISCSCYVRSDPVLLLRLLRNFVDNAVRYTIEGRILIGCRRTGACLRIEIHDTGPGIPPDASDEIFEEFHQLGNENRNRDQGLGLGLAIVHRLGQILGHPVGLRSRPGRGACFSVTVPRLVRTGPAHAARANRPGGEGELAGRFVLVIDDDEAVREAMNVLFRGWDCETLATRDLAQTIDEFEQQAYPPPDLIVCDYRLPGGSDGLAVIEHLRRRFGRTIPAILVTGDLAPEIAAGAGKVGCCLLTKPVDPDRLRLEALQAISG